jgi:hypothetical protein
MRWEDRYVLPSQSKHPYDGECWKPHSPETSFSTNVVIPSRKQLEGFDVEVSTQKRALLCRGTSIRMCVEARLVHKTGPIPVGSLAIDMGQPFQ